MIISSIKIDNYLNAKKSIEQVLSRADGIELRLDYCKTKNLDFNVITSLCREYNIIKIFTLRKKTQGGFYNKSEKKRHTDILNLLTLRPEYFDLEYDTPVEVIKIIKSKHPNVKLICSYHNHNETPNNLPVILKKIEKPFFYAYKISCYANSLSDSYRMLKLITTNNQLNNFSGICMGSYGRITRILSSIAGNYMHYTAVDKSAKTAPGQLSLDDFLRFSKGG